MFKSFKEQFEKLQRAVKKNWPDITEEEFASTGADIQQVLNMISERKNLPTEEVLQKLRKSVQEDEDHVSHQPYPN